MSVLDNVTIPSQNPAESLCWAAVTVGVCAALGISGLTLGQVAFKFFQSCGCTGVITYRGPCDKCFRIDAAIAGYGHNAASTGPMSFSALQAQIDRQEKPLPVPVLLLHDTTLHVCLIKGCIILGGVENIVLLDPADADLTDHYIEYAAFSADPQWINSYIVS